MGHDWLPGPRDRAVAHRHKRLDQRRPLARQALAAWPGSSPKRHLVPNDQRHEFRRLRFRHRHRELGSGYPESHRLENEFAELEQRLDDRRRSVLDQLDTARSSEVRGNLCGHHEFLPPTCVVRCGVLSELHVDKHRLPRNGRWVESPQNHRSRVRPHTRHGSYTKPRLRSRNGHILHRAASILTPGVGHRWTQPGLPRDVTGAAR